MTERTIDIESDDLTYRVTYYYSKSTPATHLDPPGGDLTIIRIQAIFPTTPPHRDDKRWREPITIDIPRFTELNFYNQIISYCEDEIRIENDQI